MHDYLIGREKMGNPDDFDDHGVQELGKHLAKKNIAVLVSSGIAAEKVPGLVRHFRQYGADVTVYTTPAVLDFASQSCLVGNVNLEWSSLHPVVTRLTADSEHLKPFDAYVVVPATANTIAKIAHGEADNAVLTTLVSAQGRLESGKAKILVAPTMHGTMFNSVTRDHLDELIERGMQVIRPEYKRGKVNYPGSREIVCATIRELSQSPLRGKSLFITAGNTPGWIDNVRFIGNKFTGQTGIEIAEEAYLRGADVKFVLGWSYRPVLRYLDTTHIKSFEEYFGTVMRYLQEHDFDAGIFSAAVADYIPKEKKAGKIPSKGGMESIPLKETEKVIQEVRKAHPALYMVTFKYEEMISPERLEEIAQARVRQGYQLVVANRGEEMDGRKQHSILYNPAGKVSEGFTKKEVARAIMDYLEADLR